MKCISMSMDVLPEPPIRRDDPHEITDSIKDEM
jgi:hypothetical protein